MLKSNEVENELVDLSLVLKDGDTFYDLEGNEHTFLNTPVTDEFDDVYCHFYARSNGHGRTVKISKFGVLLGSENKLPSFFLVKPRLLIPTKREENFALEFAEDSEYWWEVSNDEKIWYRASPANYLKSAIDRFYVFDFKVEDCEDLRDQLTKRGNTGARHTAVGISAFRFARKYS